MNFRVFFAKFLFRQHSLIYKYLVLFTNTFSQTPLFLSLKISSRLVSVSSEKCHRVFQFKESVPYCMSKAALDNFTRASALELGPDGIRVNCINPGYIYTNIIRRLDLPDAVVSQVSFCKF